MKKRTLALLMVLAMLCCLFAGCSKAEETVSSAADTASAAASDAASTAAAAAETATEAAAETASAAAETAGEAAAAVEEAAAAATEHQEALDAASSEFLATAEAIGTEKFDYTGTNNPDGTYTSHYGITYPIGSVDSKNSADYPLEIWESIGMFDQGINSYEELGLVGILRERTGVWFYFNDVSSSAESEQFQLAVAADTLPEMGKYANLYTGGITAAYADEVLWDLTPYVEENAPDWWAALNASTEATIDNAYDSGMILEVCGINIAYEVDNGQFTNGKFLRQYNGEMGYAEDDIVNLQSLDGLTSYLKWIKDTINPTYPAILDSSGAFPNIGNAFHTSLYSIGSTGIATYLSDDGVIVSGLVDPNYYNYLVWAKDLLDYGVFDQDFYSTDMQEQEEYMYIGTGQEGFWDNTAGSLAGVASYTDADGDLVESLPLYNVLNENGEYTFASERTLNKDAYSVATTATEEQMIAALNYFNFFFTEDGFYYANWGNDSGDPNAPIEAGIMYFDEAGDPHFTNTLIAGVDSDVWLMWRNVWKMAPYYQDPMVHYQTSETGLAQLRCAQLWTYPNYEPLTTNTVPNGAALNSDESSAVSNMVTDLCTYADEQILKFLLGTQELSEQSFAAFGDTLENQYHLSDIVGYYQFAYEDYLAGNRTSVATAGGAGGPPPDGEGGPPPEG